MTTRSGSLSKSVSLIDGLEERLSSTFKPVKPDREFVIRLKNRLASSPSLFVEEDRTSGILLWVLGILAMLVGLLLGKRLWNYLFPPENAE